MTEARPYTEQPVYVESYMLVKDLAGAFQRMPRDVRFTIGKRMLDSMLDELICVFHAFKEPQGSKAPLIRQALRHMEDAQLCLRLLNDLHALSDKFFVHTLPLSASVVKQLRAWATYASRHGQ